MPHSNPKDTLVSAIRHGREQLQKVLELRKEYEERINYVDRFKKESDKLKAVEKEKRENAARPNRRKPRRVTEKTKKQWREASARYYANKKKQQTEPDERIQLPVLMLHEFLMKHKGRQRK